MGKFLVEREQMRYPVDVYTGKIQAYPEGKPSAIAKIQVDGELMLTDLGLEGDEQAEKKIHGGPDRALFAKTAKAIIQKITFRLIFLTYVKT